MPIFYKGWQAGTKRVDVLIADWLAVELEALCELDNAHLVQAINYVEVFDVGIGLLINFGGERLEFGRPFNNNDCNI